MNETRRDEHYTGKLAEFISMNYNIAPISISPAKRGFYGETWRLDTKSRAYFLKLVYFAAHQSTYERSFPVVEHLREHGIDFTSRIVKTADGRLFTRFDGAVLGVFDWIEGENVQTNETKTHEFQMLAKVYTVPPRGVQIISEDFSGASANMFFKQWKNTNDKKIISLLEEKRAKLTYYAGRLEHFAGLCRGDNTGFFITHGDAGGNFVRSGGKYFIVDWDEVMLAPPERDAWVMGFLDWARRLFNKTLLENGIDYTLRAERLAYYCYYMYFYWLSWMVRCSQAEEIEEFFNEWGEARIEYADIIHSK